MYKLIRIHTCTVVIYENITNTIYHLTVPFTVSVSAFTSVFLHAIHRSWLCSTGKDVPFLVSVATATLTNIARGLIWKVCMGVAAKAGYTRSCMGTRLPTRPSL